MNEGATGARFVLEEFERQGVETVFGYPGGAIMPLYDAFVDSRVQHVLTRHEQAAAFAAGGYARATGRVGVCLGTSGPGATNLLTGVVDALADSVPLVVLTGQVPTGALGTDAFQETDVFGMALMSTKHCRLITSQAELARELPRAFELARSGRPGPVWLDVPKDVLAGAHGSLRPLDGPEPAPETLPDHDLDRARDLIASAERPVVVVGAGAVRDGCAEALTAFAAGIGAPIVTTLHGIGALPTDSPQLLGMLGMHGSRAANLAVQESDLLVCLGMRFDDRATGKLDGFAPLASVVHVDVDPSELGKVRRPTVGIRGTVAAFLAAYGDVATARPAWTGAAPRTDVPPLATPEGSIDPRGFIARLTGTADPNAPIVADVGQHQMWVAQYGVFCTPRSHLSSGGLGAMGFALPAAIGASMGRGSVPTYVVSGDGSFLMNVQELSTLARLRLPVRILVLDNSALGMVRQWQDLFFDGRRSSVELDDNPCFVDVARAFGVEAFAVESPDEVEGAIARLHAADGPILCHARIARDLGVWPIVAPGRSNSSMYEPNR